MKYLSLIALTVPLFFGGCLLEQAEPETEIKDVSAGLDPSINCGDVPEDKQEEADALVEKANDKAIREMEDMFNADSWDEATINAPTGALSLYNQALEVAPTHCGALFGKALASMMVLTQDDGLNDFIDKMEETAVVESREESMPSVNDEIQINSSIGNPTLNVTPEEAPTFLLKTSAKLSEADPVTIQDLQTVIANSILPEVNASISRLSAILAADDFEFNFTIRKGDYNEQTIQIDHGEVGPMLAGLRVFKSFLIVILAHELDFSDNGSYEWINTIGDIDDEDFDDLSSKERAALDHLTGLFSKNSSFTAIKPGYAKAFSEIPSELLQALNDVKTGLTYGINEAKSSENTQENDIYVVGTGIDADVDPQDLQTAVDQMEHFEKYFTGTVPITYAKGNKTLQVNFPALFKRTSNIQSFFPYHKINPYEEWNDVISADTMWKTINLDNYEYNDDISCSMKEKNGQFSILCIEDGDEDWDYTSYDYCKESSRNNEWKCIYNSSWDIDERQKGPFYFTDAAGNKTFGPGDDTPDDISDLKGTIVFPDPTFGGIFPNLTNDNIFDYIESLEDISPYDARDCGYEDYTDPDNNYTYDRWTCHTNPLPANPSDLDRLLFIFSSFDD